MEDKRKDRRLPVEAHPDESSTGNTYIEIVDVAADQVIGYVEDLSAHGLRVIGPNPVDKGRRLTARLSLSEPIDGSDSIELKLCCAWTRKDPLSSMYQSGFELESVADEDQLLLTSLLRQIAERVRHRIAAKLR